MFWPCLGAQSPGRTRFGNFQDSRSFQQYRTKPADWEWCFLYDGDELVQQPINFDHMTDNLLFDWSRFFGEWQRKEANERPFFFYFSFPQVHTALFAGKMFEGSSNRGKPSERVIKARPRDYASPEKARMWNLRLH